MTRPRGHEVSANSLRILEACEQQFRWTYGPREVRLHQEAPGLPARVGDLWHRALATLVRDRFSWGVMGPTSTRELLTALDAVAGESQFHAEALIQSRDLAEEAVRRVSPYLDDPELSPLEHKDGGVWVERSFVRELGDASLDLPSGEVGVRVGGIFDLVLASSSGRRIRIVDWKTGPGSFLGEKDAKRDPQVLLYLAAAASLWPDADEIDLHLVWIGLDAEPTRVRWSLELDDAAVALARAAVAKIATATDWPARPGDACSMCGFTRYCQERRDWLAAPPTPDAPGPLDYSDEGLASAVEELAARAREAKKEADAFKFEFKRRVEQRGVVVARGRRHFLRVVAAGERKTEPPEPRQAYDRLASEPVDENKAPVAGAPTPSLPVPCALATGPVSRPVTPTTQRVDAYNDLANAAWAAVEARRSKGEESPEYQASRAKADVARAALDEAFAREASADEAFQAEVLARAKARTAAFLDEQRSKNTPGDVAGPGPVAAPAPSTSATTPPTSPAEGAPTLSAGGVSLAEKEAVLEEPDPSYVDDLAARVADEVAREEEGEPERVDGHPVLEVAVARDPVGLACSCGRTFQNRRALSAHARSHRSEASA